MQDYIAKCRFWMIHGPLIGSEPVDRFEDTCENDDVPEPNNFMAHHRNLDGGIEF